jgi:hypothetical protein
MPQKPSTAIHSFLKFLPLVLIAGCLNESGETTTSEPVGTGGSNNHAPTISGTPSTSVTVGSLYEFTPTSSDEDGDPLTFSVSGLPSWASFDEQSGKISGIPTLADVGVTESIVITVTDGSASAALTPFSVSITQTALGSVTLSWNPPTENTDGTPLNGLTGYKIYYGTSVNRLTTQIEILNPSIMTYVVEGLVPNTYYFAATAISGDGLESELSTVARIAVN